MYFFESDPFQEINITKMTFISNSNYDEEKIVSEVKSRNIEELYAASLQMAIHGFGNKNYGSLMIDGSEKSLKTIFEENNVITDSLPGENIDSNILTPKRLQRIFRFKIKEYLEINNDIETFLYRKYSDSGEANYIFPGSEYLVEEGDQVENLLQTYKNLDDRKGTNFVEKIKSVLTARKIFFNEE